MGCGYAYDCLLFVPVTAMYVDPGACPYSKSHYVSPSCVLFLQSVTFLKNNQLEDIQYMTCISKITSSLDLCLQCLNRTSCVQDILFPPYSISDHLSFLIVLFFSLLVHALHMWCADCMHRLRVQPTAMHSYRVSNSFNSQVLMHWAKQLIQ